MTRISVRKRRILLYTLIFVVPVVVLTIAFYLGENHSGKKRLDTVVSRLEANGHLGDSDWVKTTQPPDEDNFFMAPFLSSLVDYEIEEVDGVPDIWNPVFRQPKVREQFLEMKLPHSLDRYGGYVPLVGAGGYDFSEPSDMEIWAAWMETSDDFSVKDGSLAPAELILKAINDRWEEKWTWLRDASNRKGSFVPFYLPESDELPPEPVSFVEIDAQWVFHLLLLRMLAASEAGEVETAKETIHIYLKFLEGIAAQKTDFSILMVGTKLSMLIGGVWNIIEQGKIGNGDLLWISSRLKEFNFQAYVADASKVSTSQDVEIYRWFARHRWEIQDWIWGFGGDRSFLLRLGPIVPRGWIDANLANILESKEREVILPWSSGDFSGLDGIKAREPDYQSIDSFMLNQDMIWKQWRYMAISVAKEQAELACLVEAFAKAEGKYPESLEALVPGYLEAVPNDPFTGVPYLYRLDGDRYVIYSIGSDLKDDGGVVVRNRKGQRQVFEGDWAWNFEAIPQRFRPYREDVLETVALEKQVGRPLSDEELFSLQRRLEKERREKAAKEKAEKRREILNRLKKEQPPETKAARP